MRIAFHIGAHCTDEDRLIKSLLKNKGILAAEGIIVPGPSRFRSVLTEVIVKLRGGKANRETQDVLLESITDVDDAERLVLSFDNFLGVSKRALENGQLYHLAADKVTRLRNLFPDSPVEFFIGIRDLATFIPALYERDGAGDFGAFMQGVDPLALQWVETIESIREAVPDSPITVWCNEDTPLLWPQIVHEVAGVDPQLRLKGGFDVLGEIMAKEGIIRLRSYLGTHPPQNEIQRRRILAAFLDKYALEEAIEEELDLPGWTFELTEELTAHYDDDVLDISRIPGVNMLTA